MSRPPRRSPGRTAPLVWNAPAPSGAPWFTRATLAVVALFGLALVAMIAGPHRVGDVFTETDFYGAYGPGARMLQHGHIDPSRYAVVGPVFEVLLALVGFAVRDLFVAAELIAAASATVGLLLWARLLQARAGAGVALLAVALTAVNATYFRYGFAATTDALALALQAAALLLLLSGTPTTRRVALAGLLGGLAFLTRYTAIALLPVGALALLARWAEAPDGRRGRAALVFAGGFLAPVVPWIGFSLASGAKFSFQLHHNIAYEVFARARGIPWDTYQRTLQPQFPTLWSVIARDPAAVFSHLFANVGGHLRLDALELAGLPLAIAAAAGLVFAWRDGTLVRLRAVLGWAALYFLALVPAFHSTRYSIALVPVWAAFGAIAFASPRLAVSLDAGAGRRIWLKSLLVVVPLALGLAANVTAQRRLISQLPLEVLDVARQARPLFRPGDKVLARKAHFAWHAGLESVPFPFADSLSQLAGAARAANARWLYFSWPEAEMRPQFAWLLDTSAVVPGLTVRALTAHNPAVLYEIGPGFGATPAWLADPALVAVHRARAEIAINENDWRPRLLLAAWERDRKHWDAAQALLDEAVRLAPGNVDVLLMLGDNLLQTGNLAGAGDAFANAQRLAPDNPRARIGLGWTALLDRRPADAANLWRPMVPVVDDPATLQRMVELFTLTGDKEVAAQARAKLGARGLAP